MPGKKTIPMITVLLLTAVLAAEQFSERGTNDRYTRPPSVNIDRTRTAADASGQSSGGGKIKTTGYPAPAVRCGRRTVPVYRYGGYHSSYRSYQNGDNYYSVSYNSLPGIIQAAELNPVLAALDDFHNLQAALLENRREISGHERRDIKRRMKEDYKLFRDYLYGVKEAPFADMIMQAEKEIAAAKTQNRNTANRTDIEILEDIQAEQQQAVLANYAAAVKGRSAPDRQP